MTNKFAGYLEFTSNHRDISQYHGSRSFKSEFTMESTSVRKMKGKIINESWKGERWERYERKRIRAGAIVSKPKATMIRRGEIRGRRDLDKWGMALRRSELQGRDLPDDPATHKSPLSASNHPLTGNPPPPLLASVQADVPDARA